MDAKSSRIQAIGIRSGAPLTGNAEGDDIVYALMKIRDCFNTVAQGQRLVNFIFQNKSILYTKEGE